MLNTRAISAPHSGFRIGWETVEILLCSLAIAADVHLHVFRFWKPSLWLDEMGTAHVAAAGD